MEIISQNYIKVLDELIINQFSNHLKGNLKRFREDNQVFNYINILQNLDETLTEVGRITLTNVFESIDRGYRNSVERMHKYHIKSKTTRTILTIFGEITYRKTNYSNKYTGKSYCFIDEYLGLKKYDYFDPYIKSLILEYAADNSSGKIIKFINDLIGNRLKIKTDFNYISRQTIRNIILESKLSKPTFKELSTPDTLYIMADEKWVHTQNNNKEKVMVKEIVIFDGRTTKYNKTKLLNKKIFSSFTDNLVDESLDYIYYSYDTDLLKNIYIMGDGAKWIKNLQHQFRFDNNISVFFALDQFHFKQAIHHIFQNSDLEKIAVEYIINGKRKDFILLCNYQIENNLYRKETITTKMTYILNNWRSIINLFNYKLKCPMESQISHTLASLFTSRPKGYSLKTLSKLLPLRIYYKNNYNIKSLYLNNYNKKEIIEYNQEFLNFNILNRSYQEFNNNLIPNQYLHNTHHDNTVILSELYHF